MNKGRNRQRNRRMDRRWDGGGVERWIFMSCVAVLFYAILCRPTCLDCPFLCWLPYCGFYERRSCPSGLSCSGHLVLSRMSCSAYPVIAAPFWRLCQAILLWWLCSGYLALVALSQLSYFGGPVLAVLFWWPGSGYPALVALFWLSCLLEKKLKLFFFLMSNVFISNRGHKQRCQRKSIFLK